MAKRKKHYIPQIRNPAGVIISDHGQKKDIASCHFQKAFTTQHHYIEDSSLNCIPALVSEQDNEMISAIPTEKEIQDAVFTLSADSAPGPDGFTGAFYQKAWDIISEVVISAVQEAFITQQMLPRSVTSTLIALIPKKPNALDISDYRPISLCNFFYNIFSSIVNKRLASILPKIISKEQTAFVKGRHIIENIALAQELTQELGRKTRGKNIIFKLDMAKAYDRFEWDFLFAVFHRFGFSLPVIQLIRKMVTNCWFSVLMNGDTAGFFKSTRGVRQGDPIAPSLFIIAEESFSRSLKQAYLNSQVESFQGPGRCPPISHLLFADDTMIFSKASLGSVKNLLKVLKTYERSSGQLINVSKSGFFLHPRFHGSIITRISNVTGFNSHSFPHKYLGSGPQQKSSLCRHYSIHPKKNFRMKV